MMVVRISGGNESIVRCEMDEIGVVHGASRRGIKEAMTHVTVCL